MRCPYCGEELYIPNTSADSTTNPTIECPKCGYEVS